MPLTLYLIRHAEAESSNGGQKDIDRALTSVGIRDANHLGIFLANAQVHPDLMITSSAMRASHTAEILAENIKYGVDKIKVNEELYEAPIRVLLNTINNQNKENKLIVLIGHNPAISYLADYLTGEDIGNMSPCTIIEVEFEIDDWSLVAAKTGTSKLIRHPG